MTLEQAAKDTGAEHILSSIKFTKWVKKKQIHSWHSHIKLDSYFENVFYILNTNYIKWPQRLHQIPFILLEFNSNL